MKTFQDYLDENHLKPGTKLKKGDEELKVVKPVGDDKYLVKEEEVEIDESMVARTQNGRRMVSAEAAIRLARELAAKRKEGEKATHKDLQAASAALRKEEVELTEAKHRVSVTVSDPNHTAVSKRKEQTQKTVRVSAESESDAVTKAKAFYKKQGYKVHDATHAGMVHEALEQIDELNSDTLKSYADKRMERVKNRYAKLTAKQKAGAKVSNQEIGEYNKDTKKDLDNINKARDKAANKRQGSRVDRDGD